MILANKNSSAKSTNAIPATFPQEVEKLDSWADNLKLGLEQEIKEIDREIKETRPTAATSPTLDGKLHWQKHQRDLEGKRNKLRRELWVYVESCGKR